MQTKYDAHIRQLVKSGASIPIGQGGYVHPIIMKRGRPW